MKYIPTFESFLFEEAAERVTINAGLWSNQKPEVVNEPQAKTYRFYSGEVFGGKYINFLGKPNVVAIVIEEMKGDNTLWIKIGYGSEDDKGIKVFRVVLGDSLEVKVDDLKADPKGIAKKAADMFVAAKRAFDMNFEPYGKRTIFKLEKDLEKPTLELIEFTLKNLK